MCRSKSERRFSPWFVLPILAAAASCAHGSLVGDSGARLLSAVVFGGYPKLTGRFSPLPGPHPVSFRRTRLGGDGCEAQVLYPSKEGTGRRGRYARRDLPSGLADFTSLPRFLYRPLSARSHPCPEHGDLADVPGGPLPVVIFSHGLGGCAEMYTGLCASLASYGIIVCAIEHQDGSGCFARAPDGETVPYKRYDGPKVSNYTRELLVEYRAPFLRQRVEETVVAIRHLMAKEDGVLASADKSEVHLLGHSFGAATMTLVSQQFEEVIDQCKTYNIGSVSLLDAWLTPLEDLALDKGVSRRQLHVLSQPWCKGPEFDAAIRLSQASRTADASLQDRPIFYAAPLAQHASFSDAPNWFPSLLTKKFGVRGKNEQLYATHRAVALLVNKAVRGEDTYGSSGSATEQIMAKEEVDILKTLELLNLGDAHASECLLTER